MWATDNLEVIKLQTEYASSMFLWKKNWMCKKGLDDNSVLDITLEFISVAEIPISQMPFFMIHTLQMQYHESMVTCKATTCGNQITSQKTKTVS